MKSFSSFHKPQGLLGDVFICGLHGAFLMKIIQANNFQILLSTIHIKKYTFYCHMRWSSQNSSINVMPSGFYYILFHLKKKCWLWFWANTKNQNAKLDTCESEILSRIMLYKYFKNISNQEAKQSERGDMSCGFINRPSHIRHVFPWLVMIRPI